MNTPPPPVTPPPQQQDDSPPPLYESVVSVSPISLANNSFNASHYCGMACAVPAGNFQCRPWTTVSITSWRATAAGMVWHVLDTFNSRGHIGITHDVMRLLHQYLPPVDGNEEYLPTVAVTAQVLATIGHGEYVLRQRARRDKRAIPRSFYLLLWHHIYNHGRWKGFGHTICGVSSLRSSTGS